MHSAATKRQMPPAVCKPTPMAERIRFFFMLFMFLSVLFVRVDVLLHLFISDIPHLLEIFEAEVEAELTEAVDRLYCLIYPNISVFVHILS